MMTVSRPVPGVALLVLAIGVSTAFAQETKQAKKAYAKSPDAVQGLILLKAIGLMPAGKSDDDFGRMADIRIADGLTVTGVPAEFLEKCAEAALIQGWALGLFPEQGDGPAFEKAVKEKTLDPRQAARALAAWWTAEILAEWKVDAKKKPPTQDLLRKDAERTRTLQDLKSGPEGALTAAWLLFPQGVDTFSPDRKARKPVSFRMLVERFDPDQPVTDKNAEAVAEELVWTQRLGLGDGTLAKLPDARRIFQALLLEKLGFEIGDPMDADKSKRESARTKLTEARRTAAEAWKAK